MEVEECVRSFAEARKCEVLELHVQIDPVHLPAMISPKVSVLNYFDLCISISPQSSQRSQRLPVTKGHVGTND